MEFDWTQGALAEGLRRYNFGSDIDGVLYNKAPLTMSRWPKPDYVFPPKMLKSRL